MPSSSENSRACQSKIKIRSPGCVSTTRSIRVDFPVPVTPITAMRRALYWRLLIIFLGLQFFVDSSDLRDACPVPQNILRQINRRDGFVTKQVVIAEIFSPEPDDDAGKVFFLRRSEEGLVCQAASHGFRMLGLEDFVASIAEIFRCRHQTLDEASLKLHASSFNFRIDERFVQAFLRKAGTIFRRAADRLFSSSVFPARCR